MLGSPSPVAAGSRTSIHLGRKPERNHLEQVSEKEHVHPAEPRLLSGDERELIADEEECLVRDHGNLRESIVCNGVDETRRKVI